MERLLERKLIEWNDSADRLPLVITGVRQCGKTHLMKDFGERHFDDVAYFLFEGNRDLDAVFRRDMDPCRIVCELGILRGREISEDTLIIFDEVQFCYPALTSLKYFAELAPEYRIMCAGSLLGLSISSTRGSGDSIYSFPVGKVRFLKLRPMCFAEFVLAKEGRLMFDLLDTVGNEGLPESVLPRLSELHREYLCVGGMPKAVQTWIDTGSMEAVEEVLDGILMSYDADIAKHCPDSFTRVSNLWDSIAEQAAEGGDRFRLKDAGGNSRSLSEPIQWLIRAEMVHRTWQVDSVSIPLRARGGVHFKLYLCDVGLLRRKAGVSCRMLFSDDSSLFRGGLTENFVLNELRFALDAHHDSHYWANPKGISEVDFLEVINDRVVPIEVKSGRIGRVRSLEVYCERYSPETAVVVSNNNLRVGADGEWTFLPLSLVWRIRDFVPRNE